MNQGVYSAKDLKTGIYNNPFLTRHEAEAIRMFAGAANDPKTMIHTYPSDFELFKVADWNDTTGKYTNLETPHFVMNGLTAKELNKSINQLCEER